MATEETLTIKPISKAAVPAALEKAEQYRLLNDPMLAESICLDVLDVEPSNQQNLVCLILSMTDQFHKGISGDALRRLKTYVGRLDSEYHRAYYSGLIAEREARAVIEHPYANLHAYEGFRDAMDWYEKAEKLASPGNEDAKLRYNTCVRWIQREGLVPAPSGNPELPLE